MGKIASPYLTAEEAAIYLWRPWVQSIYALLKRGRLKPMPEFGRLLLTKEELDACLQRKRKRSQQS